MPIEVANAMARVGKDGKKYGDCTTDALTFKKKNHTNKLNSLKNETVVENMMKDGVDIQTLRDELLAKVNDIDIILDWRKTHSA